MVEIIHSSTQRILREDISMVDEASLYIKPSRGLGQQSHKLVNKTAEFGSHRLILFLS
jgi:hypothetical protein